MLSEAEMKIIRVHVKNFREIQEVFHKMQLWIWSSCNLLVFSNSQISQILTIFFWKKKRLCNPRWTYLFIEHIFFLHFEDTQFADESFNLSLLKKGIEFYFYFTYLNYILTMWNSHITNKHKHLIPHILHPHIITGPRQFQIYATESISRQMNLMYHPIEISNNYGKNADLIGIYSWWKLRLPMKGSLQTRF